EGFRQGGDVAGAGAGEAYFGEEAFEVEDGFEAFRERGAEEQSGAKRFEGVEAGFDFGDVDGRSEKAAAQEASTHAGAGFVEHVKQRRFLRFAGEEGLD